MGPLQKVLVGLVFCCILVAGIVVVFHQENKTRESDRAVLNITNPAVSALIGNPLSSIPASDPVVTVTGFPNTSISLDRNWIKMKSDPILPVQYWHCSVALGDRSILVMGGQGMGTGNDVWRSPDHGITWNQMTSHAGWSERIGQSCVALPDGGIVLMGGSFHNDVWRSTDSGATWTELTGHARWSPRQFQSSVVMSDGSILLIGGILNDRTGAVNDVWRSTDKGATWTRMNGDPPWPARSYQSAVALPDGSVVVMGGAGYNDVWRSPDYGITWTRMTGHAGWTPRFGQSAVALQGGSILLMGGRDPAMKNDTWISDDEGATWGLVNRSSGWEPREFATSVVTHDGSVVLIGGDGETGMKNDVWVFLQAGEPVPTKQPTPTPLPASEPKIWITINPVGNISVGSIVTLTGSTNLIPGSGITITPRMVLHSCPPGKPLFALGHSLCDRNCNFQPAVGIARVEAGPDGNSTWAFAFRTDEWCEAEEYWFTAGVDSWTNVTPASISFRYP